MSENKPEPSLRKFKLFPDTLAHCVCQITKPVFKKQGLEVELMKAWPDIVGAKIAAYAQPSKFSRMRDGTGTLTIDILPSQALLAQHMQPLILEKLAVFHGSRKVTRLAFQQKASLMSHLPPTEQEAGPHQREMLKQFAALKESLKK